MDLSTFIISVFCLIDDRSSSFVAPFPSSWRSLGLDAQDVILPLSATRSLLGSSILLL